MNFEELQKTWQTHDAGPKVTIDADALLKEVRRNQQQFWATIFWRDVREVGIAALLAPLFAYWGWKGQWASYLCAFGCFVVGADMVLDRFQQRKKTQDVHSSLKDCAATSLAEVSHQIWLLKNVLWWYLLPLYVPIMVLFGSAAWGMPGPVAAKILFLLILTGFVTVLYGGIYWLNQFAVNKNLEPRREELEKLIDQIEANHRTATVTTKKPLIPLLLVLAVCVIAVILHAAMKS